MARHGYRTVHTGRPAAECATHYREQARESTSGGGGGGEERLQQQEQEQVFFSNKQIKLVASVGLKGPTNPSPSPSTEPTLICLFV